MDNNETGFSLQTPFAASLSAIKERTGRSYRELAKGSLMSAAALHRYCAGTAVPPDFAVILRFARAHGTSRSDLAKLHHQWTQARYAAEDMHEKVRTVPHQLPADIVSFTGREALLSTLDRRLGETGLVVIQGPPGVGKSALAVHIAHRLTGRFPDGQLYVNLQGSTVGLSPLLPVEAIGRMLRALEIAPASIPSNVDEAASLLRTTLATQRVLLLLDNAADSAQVGPLLPGAAGNGVIVTGRRLLANLPNAAHIQLGELTDEESLLLLTRLADREVTDEAAVVARLCGGLPLALSIAATRLNSRPTWTAEHLAQHLSAAYRRLDHLETADTSVRASFAVSFDDLRSSKDSIDREAARLFTLLGMPAGPDIGVPVAAILLDTDQDTAYAVLERLVDTHLLTSSTVDRYRTHDLLRLYAQELARGMHTEAESAETMRRLLRFYVATAWTTAEMLMPGAERLSNREPHLAETGLTFAGAAEAVDWLEVERANIMAAARLGMPGSQLAQAMFAFFRMRGHVTDWIEINELAAQTDDLPVRALAISDLGLAYDRLGDPAEAQRHQQHALELFLELGDAKSAAACRSNLGVLYARMGRYDDAIACHEQNLVHLREIGHLRGQAVTLNNLGVVLGGEPGRLTEALACHAECLDLRRQIGDRRGEALSLANIGIIHDQLGDLEAAITHQRMAYEAFCVIGDLEGQAEALKNMGASQIKAGQHAEGLARVDECLAIFERLGDAHGLAETHHQAALALLAQERTELARDHLHQALSLYEQVGSADADTVRVLLAKLDDTRV